MARRVGSGAGIGGDSTRTRIFEEFARLRLVDSNLFRVPAVRKIVELAGYRE
jgi:hypothetical protein